MEDRAVSVLFVCMGNICRSPTAEGVFRALLEARGLADKLSVDSAGTHAFHVGNPPDARSQAAARAHGYDLSRQRARQLKAEDCQEFAYILTMDQANFERVTQLCPEPKATIAPLLSYAPELGRLDVPDPYYGGERGFEEVLELIEKACEKLLAEILEHLELI